ncbi:MAG: hypothetical protein GPJ54_18495 [Candidatus Heimdallarchaeota archaeon]|nr:hypothetical protein [Candidatus Heimdallarchaeota archaeon]
MAINNSSTVFRKRKGYLKLLLSHHPLCGFFESDTYNISKLKICKGCTAGYSGIYIGIYLFITSLIPAFLIIKSVEQYFTIVLIAGFITLLYEFQRKKIIPRFPIRLMMGTLFIVSIYAIIKLDNWFHKYLIIMFLFFFSNIIGYSRYRKLQRVCSTNCGERRLDWCEYALGDSIPPELIQLNTFDNIIEPPVEIDNQIS